MKNIILSLFFLSVSAFGNEACSSYLGVKVNGFIGETLETLAKSSDCNENLKTLKFNTVEGQLKSDYCACVSTNPKSLSGKSLATLKNDPKYKESKDKAKKAIEEKYAKALRNKIFGTLSRSFKFDNLAKRGYLSNGIARDKNINNCNLDNILSNIGDFRVFKELNPSCEKKDKLFEERKKLLFPEGEEAFIQNLKDTANTVAKGVRANGSCLTYQNYLELNSTVPENSEAIKIMMRSSSWEDFKASIAEELRYYDNFKSLQNQMRSSANERTAEVSNNLWGFGGKKIKGKDVYRMIKSNPNFELALRDKDIFEQMKNSLNLFENDHTGSNGGFINYSATKGFRDFNDLLKNNSDVALKAHLKSCDSSQLNNPRGGGRGIASTRSNGDIGLKQTIAKFLCDDELPSGRVEALNSSLDEVVGHEEKTNKALRDVVRSDLICEAKTSPNSAFFSNIDSMLDIPSDLDIEDKNNFLGDYKDFSVAFCSMVDMDCSDHLKSSQNPKCASLSAMVSSSMENNVTSLIERLNKLPQMHHVDRMNLNHRLFDPEIPDEKAVNSAINYLIKKYPNKLSEDETQALREKLILLRSHSDDLNLEKLTRATIVNDEFPDYANDELSKAVFHNKWKDFYQTDVGKKFLSEIKDKGIVRRINGIILNDTSLNLQSGDSDNLFADIYTNGHKVNGSNEKSPSYINEGPEVDTNHYGYNIERSSTKISTSNTGRENEYKEERNSVPSIDNGVPPVLVDTPPGSSETSVGSSGSTKIRTLDDLIARNTSTQKRTPSSKIEPPKVDKPKEDTPVVTESSNIEEPKSTTERKTVNLENGSNLPNSTALQTISFTSSGSSIERGGGSGSSTNQLITDDGESPADKLKKQKMLDEIARIKKQLKEGNSNTVINDESDTSNMESENDRFRARIKALEDEFDRRNKTKSNNYSNNVSNLSSSSGYDNDYDSDYSNNFENRSNTFNPRDPFKRAETKREVTPEHMDELDPAGLPIANRGGKGKSGQTKGGGGFGLTSGSDGGGLAALGLRPLKKRGIASESDELEPEEVCDFDQQELNCIFEHSEIFKRYDKNQIRSLVEGLLLHGYSFKTIDIINTRDPNKPHKYIVHFFEPEKNLSKEEKLKRLELIKKMLLDYKKNYNFLKAIASKVVKTRSVEISKGEAFTTLKHTLKKTDIDRLLKRRLSLIERVPASKK